jgi:carotenoid cleavage dioxygenase
MQQKNEKPYWLRGNMAPVQEEVTAFDLKVEGSIPTELSGLYARNGANPRDGHSGHWFLGDGMVHGVSLKNGKAEWYRNRWVRTPRFEGATFEGDAVFSLKNSLANTSVVAHAGHLFALVENALPMEITRDLDTAGFYDYGGKLKTPFTAHPKICPLTGELHFFGYSILPPFLTYHVADASGALVRTLEIPTSRPTMMHDFALTAGHAIFMDLPLVLDLESARRGTMPFAWSDEYGARLGIIPRGAGPEALRWVDIEPCYVYHVANAFEETDGTIVIDVAWYRELWRGGPSDSTFESASLKRWRIRPGAAKAEEEAIDDRSLEFPRVNEAHTGLLHSVVYAVGTAGDLSSGRRHSILKYNLRTGAREERAFQDRLPGEFVFVPGGPKTAEDEGWLLGFVYDPDKNGSDLLILDAQDIGGKPVARIGIPQRVPQGFHGSWFPDAVAGA